MGSWDNRPENPSWAHLTEVQILVPSSALHERALQEIGILQIEVEMFLLMNLAHTPTKPKPGNFCNARFLSSHGLAQPSFGRTRMKTLHPLFHIHCQPETERDDLTPSTIASRGFEKEAPFPIGEALFMSVAPSVRTRPWWRSVWRNRWRNH